MNAEINAALTRWIEADRLMREAVAAELEARAALTWIAFPTPFDGTNNQPLPDGKILQAVFKQNYNVDSKLADATLKKLPPAVARSLLTWNAKLKVGAYKALEPAHKAIVNEIVTITPARPSLEIVEPKER